MSLVPPQQPTKQQDETPVGSFLEDGEEQYGKWIRALHDGRFGGSSQPIDGIDVAEQPLQTTQHAPGYRRATR